MAATNYDRMSPVGVGNFTRGQTVRCFHSPLARWLIPFACIFIVVVPAAPAAQLVLVAGGREEQVPALATKAKLNGPFGVEFNASGTLFFVEMPGNRVCAVDAHGVLKTVAGTGEKGNSGDGGPALSATFDGMHNLAIGARGDIYIADTWNHRVRKLDPAGKTITAFAGTGRKGFSGDGGPADKAEFGAVYCVALQPDGRRLLIADLDNRRIRAITLAPGTGNPIDDTGNPVAGTVETVAGNGERGVPTDGALAREAPLADPRAVAADARGNIYILERGGNALRVVDTAGHIRTVAGKGTKDCRDEEGREPSPLNGPKHLCIDLDGNVVIADTENHMIRKYLPAEHKLVRIAGTGQAGAAGLDGPPLAAQLNQPHGVFVHPTGTLYIADSSNNRIVKITP
jgi:sugar lactone lactonase YvrE